MPFDGKSILIGRRDGCDIKLLEDSVSTTHAIIFEMDGRRYIRDLASRTGTFVNGKQIHQVELMPGDEVKCGQTEMRYVTEGPAGAFAPPARVPADLGANIDDLMEFDTPSAPSATSAAAAAAAAAAAGPAGTDELELVQDEAAEIEPVEIEAAGVDLEPLEGAEAEAEADADLAPLPIDQDDDEEIVDLATVVGSAAAEAPPAEIEIEQDALSASATARRRILVEDSLTPLAEGEPPSLQQPIEIADEDVEIEIEPDLAAGSRRRARTRAGTRADGHRIAAGAGGARRRG